MRATPVTGAIQVGEVKVTKTRRLIKRLITILSLQLLTTILWAQNPHGDSFKTNCSTCHSADSWEINFDSLSFNHDTTGFVLTGQHQVTSCTNCHEDLVFAKAQNNCVTCHIDVHNMTVGDDCMRCHTTSNWLVDNIPQLHEQNGFPLFGAHDMLTCLECHQSQSSLQWSRIGNECLDCHMSSYQATTNPNHIASGLSTDCINCHSPLGDQWGQPGFHESFPLTLGHNVASCSECHEGNNFTSTSSDCVDCHINDYNNTNNPNHATANFSTDCSNCHTTNPGWSPTTLGSGDFHSFFPLTLGHNIQDCATCHDVNNYANISNECSSCHINDFNSTTNPNHVAANFSTSCTGCHTTNPGWSPTTLGSGDFHSFFPLTLGHNIQDCASCHDVNDYTNISSECSSCHINDFNSTTNPSHVAANFSTSCTDCHTTTPGWSPTVFGENYHSSFPLTQGHNIKDCAACHNTNNYSDISNDCASCHLTDFNNTQSPNHQTSNFSHQCTDCHTTAPGWKPAEFTAHDNSYFPIYSGKHRGKWSSCTECHVSDGNFTLFSCIDCHEHSDESRVTRKHREVKNFTYTSTSCYDCHPTGREH